MGYSPKGRKKLDTTERLSTQWLKVFTIQRKTILNLTLYKHSDFQLSGEKKTFSNVHSKDDEWKLQEGSLRDGNQS